MSLRWATKDDAPYIAPLLNLVFEEMEVPALMKMPQDELYELFEEAFSLPDYRYGYKRTLVHVDDETGVVNGLLASYSAEDEPIVDEPFKPFLHRLGFKPGETLFPDREADDGEYYLDLLAVLPSAQGQGIGGALLDGIEPLIKEKGYDILSLNVDLENPLAERLYTKHGYKFEHLMTIGSHEYKHLIKKI